MWYRFVRPRTACRNVCTQEDRMIELHWNFFDEIMQHCKSMTSHFSRRNRWWRNRTAFRRSSLTVLHTFVDEWIHLIVWHQDLLAVLLARKVINGPKTDNASSSVKAYTQKWRPIHFKGHIARANEEPAKIVFRFHEVFGKIYDFPKAWTASKMISAAHIVRLLMTFEDELGHYSKTRTCTSYSSKEVFILGIRCSNDSPIGEHIFNSHEIFDSQAMRRCNLGVSTIQGQSTNSLFASHDGKSIMPS